MQTLNDNELNNVHGGNPWAWMLLGYVAGEIIDGVRQNESTGWAADKTLTRRGYR